MSQPGDGADSSPNGTGTGVQEASEVESSAKGSVGGVEVRNGGDDDKFKDTITLPQSTHSLLFTEPICSIPWAFGFIIFGIVSSSLSFALIDALQQGGPGNQFNIPADVKFTVRGSQYLAIIIVLLMEEEIPTGLYLLRAIPRKSFESRFPGKPYGKFVFSALLRIWMGYVFLSNVFLVLIQAKEVLTIFYDVLALQFIQQLDDVAFKLATWDILGKRVYRASTAKCYRVEFKKEKGGKKTRTFLKVVYLINLAVFLAGLGIMTANQKNGNYYKCNGFVLDLGEDIWEDAVVMTSSGEYEEERVLVYSHFNGVYARADEDHDGRPMFREMRKYDSTQYETTIPAEIKYCKEERSWIFSHPNLTKSKYSEETGCSAQWLLRSPDARDEFDLMNVEGDWDIWTGKISKSSVSIVRNGCWDDSDCNLDGGECVDGFCKCYKRDGYQYLGSHCDAKLKDSCHTIIGEGYNDTWSVAYLPSPNGSLTTTMLEQYMRPQYYHVGGLPGVGVGNDDLLSIIYSGSRWFGVYLEGQKNKPLEEWILGHTAEYHAFWDEMYSNNTLFVSDPTTSSIPVGVDFYLIGRREPKEQFGPFGELIPSTGVYRCSGSGSVSMKDNSIISKRRLELKR